MKKNMGDADRAIRIVAAALIVILYLLGVVAGMVGTILLLLAVIFLVTSFVGVCPLYKLFGIDSCKSRNEKDDYGTAKNA